MNEKALTIGNVSGLVCGASYMFDIGNTIYMIVCILSLIVSIICGVLNIYARIKKSLEDNKITEEEQKAIIDDISGLKNEIEEGMQNYETNRQNQRNNQGIDDKNN